MTTMSCHGQFCHLGILKYLLNHQVLTFYGSLILQPMDLITSVIPTLLYISMCSLGLYFIHNKVILKVTLSLDLSLTLESLFHLQFEWHCDCVPFNETRYEFTRFIWFCSDQTWRNEQYEQTVKVQVMQIQNWGWNSAVRINLGEKTSLVHTLSFPLCNVFSL
jgi:hypothetical protein